jgi:hypothetical protein
VPGGADAQPRRSGTIRMKAAPIATW